MDIIILSLTVAVFIDYTADEHWGYLADTKFEEDDYKYLSIWQLLAPLVYTVFKMISSAAVIILEILLIISILKILFNI